MFLVLLDIYLSVPPQPSTSSHESHIDSNSTTTTNSNSNSTTNIQAALDLLKNHSTKIDPLKAINLLPCSVPVSLLKQFLQSMAYHLLVERHGGQIFKNLLLAQHLQVNNQRIRLQQLNKIVIDEHDLCRVCQKRIAKRYDNGLPNFNFDYLSCFFFFILFYYAFYFLFSHLSLSHLKTFSCKNFFVFLSYLYLILNFFHFISFQSVFLRFPNKDLVHLMCKDKYNSR